MPYVQFDVPPDTAAGIARFYEQVLGCPATCESGTTRVAMGHNQEIIFF